MALGLERLGELPKDRRCDAVEKRGPALVGNVERGSAFRSQPACVLDRGEDTLADVASVESVNWWSRSHLDSVARSGLDDRSGVEFILTGGPYRR